MYVYLFVDAGVVSLSESSIFTSLSRQTLVPYNIVSAHDTFFGFILHSFELFFILSSFFFLFPVHVGLFFLLFVTSCNHSFFLLLLFHPLFQLIFFFPSRSTYPVFFFFIFLYPISLHLFIVVAINSIDSTTL